MRIEMAARLLLTQSKAQREMIREVFPGTLHYHMSKLDEVALKESHAVALRMLRAYFGYLEMKFEDRKDLLSRSQPSSLATSAHVRALIGELNLAFNCEMVVDMKAYTNSDLMWNLDGTPKFWNSLHDLLALEVADVKALADGTPIFRTISCGLTSLGVVDGYCSTAEEEAEIESRWGTMVEVARIICKLDDKGDRWGITKVMACEDDAVLLLK